MNPGMPLCVYRGGNADDGNGGVHAVFVRADAGCSDDRVISSER